MPNFASASQRSGFNSLSALLKWLSKIDLLKPLTSPGSEGLGCANTIGGNNPQINISVKKTAIVLLKYFLIIFCSKSVFYTPHKRNNFLFKNDLNECLEKNKSDGIMVIEQRHEHVTPKALTSDNVRISEFAPSVRNRNGIAPTMVVPLVARRAGIFLRIAR
jgi:hypothetical protein